MVSGKEEKDSVDSPARVALLRVHDMVRENISFKRATTDGVRLSEVLRFTRRKCESKCARILTWFDVYPTFSLRLTQLIAATTEGDGEAAAAATVTTKLLMPNGQTGTLIGKGGSTIKSIQEQSGATIRVTETNEAPPCALPDDRHTERCNGNITEVSRGASRPGRVCSWTLSTHSPDCCLTSATPVGRDLRRGECGQGSGFTDRGPPASVSSVQPILLQHNLACSMTIRIPTIITTCSLMMVSHNASCVLVMAVTESEPRNVPATTTVLAARLHAATYSISACRCPAAWLAREVMGR
eukprot:48210-Pyramimonas_sp.AAC.1